MNFLERNSDNFPNRINYNNNNLQFPTSENSSSVNTNFNKFDMDQGIQGMGFQNYSNYNNYNNYLKSPSNIQGMQNNQNMQNLHKSESRPKLSLSSLKQYGDNFGFIPKNFMQTHNVPQIQNQNLINNNNINNINNNQQQTGNKSPTKTSPMGNTITSPNSKLNNSNNKNENKSYMYGKIGWVCSMCKNFNYEKRVKCNRCGKPQMTPNVENLKKMNYFSNNTNTNTNTNNIDNKIKEDIFKNNPMFSDKNNYHQQSPLLTNSTMNESSYGTENKLGIEYPFIRYNTVSTTPNYNLDISSQLDNFNKFGNITKSAQGLTNTQPNMSKILNNCNNMNNMQSMQDMGTMGSMGSHETEKNISTHTNYQQQQNINMNMNTKHPLHKSNSTVTPSSNTVKKVKKPFVERPGDWVCIKCKNLNFSFRGVCNRCQLTKLESDKLFDQYMKNLMSYVKINEICQQGQQVKDEQGNIIDNNQMGNNNMNNNNAKKLIQSYVNMYHPGSSPFNLEEESLNNRGSENVDQSDENNGNDQ